MLEFLLRGIEKDQVERGQVLPNRDQLLLTQNLKQKFIFLSKEEGGRHTPFFTGYKPQFYIKTADVTGEATLPEGIEMVMPGDNAKMKVKLISPVAWKKDSDLQFVKVDTQLELVL